MPKAAKKSEQHYGVFSPILIFIGLILVLLLAIYVIATVTQNYSESVVSTNPAPNTEPQEIDTTDWQTYTDNTLKISFAHPKEWFVRKQNIESGELITVSPHTVTDTANQTKIFVQNSGFFGTEGLPTTSITINGKQGIMVDEGLYGFEHNGKFLTFDAGYNAEARPYFTALVRTVEFH